MATPIKSPTYAKASETPAIISDFKNRFQQHQQQLQQQQHQQPIQHHNTSAHQQENSPLASISSNKFDQIQEEYVVIEKKDLDECKQMQFLNLGSTIKESLTLDEMDRLALLAKFYSQLILSNLKIISLNLSVNGQCVRYSTFGNT